MYVLGVIPGETFVVQPQDLESKEREGENSSPLL